MTNEELEIYKQGFKDGFETAQSQLFNQFIPVNQIIPIVSIEKIEDIENTKEELRHWTLEIGEENG